MSEYMKWTKSHKKEFVHDFISSSNVKEDGQPSAMFTAGLPGAGKTEVTKSLIRVFDLQAIRIDMDEIASRIPGYEPEKADLFRKPATTLLNEIFSMVLKRKLDFIMDGTFASPYAAQNVKRALRHGYNVRILYILQDPKIAWNFTLAREKIEHRAIKIDGFIKSYFNTQKNLKKVFEMDSKRVSVEIIVKNAQNQDGIWLTNVDFNEFDKVVSKSYNEENLRKYLDAR